VLGLILDNLIVFFFRLIRIAIGVCRSNRWKTTRAEIHDSYAEGGSYPFASVHYDYVVDGVRHSGEYLKGFWYESSAREFAGIFPARRSIVVRYRPTNPAKSFLRESDQVSIEQLTPLGQ
jgi:hypothetical protein